MGETTKLLGDGAVTIPHDEIENKKNNKHTLRNACVALLIAFAIFYFSGDSLREGARDNVKKFSSKEAAGPSSAVADIFYYVLNIRKNCNEEEVEEDEYHLHHHHYHHHSYGNGESEDETTTDKPTPAPASSPTSTTVTSSTSAPVSSPTSAPTASPTSAPTASPTSAPTASPTSAPIPAPTSSPIAASTSSPVSSSTSAPVSAPTSAPVSAPTSAPVSAPTSAPVSAPTSAPVSAPTSAPASSPTPPPTVSPTVSPTPPPTVSPTPPPTASPTVSPTPPPTVSPTVSPTSPPVDESGRNNGDEGNESNAKIPLNMNFIRSINGSEDRRAGIGAVLVRMTDPDYPDGAGVGLSMITQPSARGISNMVFDPNTLSTPPAKSTASDMLWQWGQFIDHDMSFTPGRDEGFTIVSPTCNSGDTICRIGFSRAIHVFSNGVRQHINEFTGFLDASHIYGLSQDTVDELRDFTGGRLLTAEDNLMPRDVVPPRITGSDNFKAGDFRVNETPPLISLHTLFLREHNRIAGLLEKKFPSASDEELYQMTRKLVTAEVQAITYKEFLPTLIGSFAPDISAYKGHDASVNPGMATEFSVVAFRHGHSMVSSNFMLHDGTQQTGSFNILSTFFSPKLIRDNPNLVDELLFGLTIKPAELADTKVITEIRNSLFGLPRAGVGLDLVSLNIQRGRDCGVKRYNALRVGLGLPRKATFSDVTSNREVAAELAAVYPSPDQCDPWVCGLAEDHVGGGQLGELFSIIIADQFQRLMDGDEFFYLNDRDVRNRSIKSVIDVDSITLTEIINLNTVGGLSGSAMLAGL